MNRPIVDFDTDDEGVHVALLTCGHRQHVRHDPPFVDRAWVLTEIGRSQKIGLPLNCVRCDRFELPTHFVAYRRTPEFSEQTVPAGLRKDHSTKVGVWAKIVVLEGRLRYRIEAPAPDRELTPYQGGIVLPEVRHSVQPIGAVRFYVEFYAAP